MLLTPHTFDHCGTARTARMAYLPCPLHPNCVVPPENACVGALHSQELAYAARPDNFIITANRYH